MHYPLITIATSEQILEKSQMPEFTAHVVGDNDTPGAGLYLSGTGRVYYFAMMEGAQEALGQPSSQGPPSPTSPCDTKTEIRCTLSPAYPPSNAQLSNFQRIVQAIGTAIGNAAAHENGHYLEQIRTNGNPGLPVMDCGLNSNNKSKVGQISCDKDKNGSVDNFVYEFYNADGYPQDPTDPKSFRGQVFYFNVPGEPAIDWGPSDDCWIQKWIYPSCKSWPCGQ